MSASREELQEALCQYTTDTLIHINTVKEFCDKMPKWVLARETELNMMTDIDARANVKITEDFVEYMKKTVSDGPRQELEKELATVLKDTLRGLEELQWFLDAVERLAVTSPSVFKEDNQVVQLPKGINLQDVLVVMANARMLCPLLVDFKRDDSEFFLPRLHNVAVLAYQLDRYIRTSEKMCDILQKCCVFEVTSPQPVLDLQGLCDDDIERMLCLINMCQDIRNDQHFRMVSLFQEDECSSFIREFGDRKPRMIQFLNELEESAVQLERMNFGTKVSSVVGSSVGVVGGVLSIVGLALIPVTLGASVALTMTGVGLGVTSGVNSAVTAATEVGVNRKWQGKASKVFQSFMEDVEKVQERLKTTMDRASDLDVALVVGKMIGNVGAIGKGIDSLVDGASALKVLKSEDVLMSTGKVLAEEGKALRNVPKMASDIPDVGQAVAKAPLAMSKSARAGFIALNALFIGLDVFFICKDSISLAKGSETDASQFIRARAALWRSEVDAWEKMSESLCEGQLSFEKKQDILETDFYLDEDWCDAPMGKMKESDGDFLSDEEIKEKGLCVIQ